MNAASVRRLSVCCIISLSVSFAFVRRVILDKRGDGVVDRAMVVDPNEFTAEKIEQLVDQFLAADAPTAKLRRLTIGIDATETARSISAPGGAFDVPGPSSPRAQIDQLGWPSTPVARALVMGGSGLLSIREGAKLIEKVIGERDSTRITIDNSEFRLLNFAIEGSGLLTLYFMTEGKLSIAAGEQLTGRMRELTGRVNLYTNLLNDAWFVASGYPHVFRFAEVGPIPNKANYDAKPYVFCLSTPAKTECFGRNLAEK